MALREMGRRGGPQRVTHIMSAPVESWARCGLPQQWRAAGRRGSALWCGVAHGRVAVFLSNGVRLAAGVRLCGAVWRTARRLALLSA
ncbi:hypothetical protein [Pectobacterium parmentieri]|uniref:hypothetical protein n=1 Tax=Pectobacterium parmentieri TaxID=1905730 RepID=UPI0013C51E78|nr:hypothetical protein [Pectobacterium parmentieri]